MGYLNHSEATQDSFDSEGYFHTGDIGCLDIDGYLEITGRLKELIITAGGENVSPVPIENLIKESCPLLNYVVLIGDERKFLSCLLTMKTKFDI